jgi:hypothetical protein
MQFPYFDIWHLHQKKLSNTPQDKNCNVLKENVPKTNLEICLDRIQRFDHNNQTSCPCNLDEKDITYLQNEGYKVTDQKLWKLVEWNKHS